LLGRDDQPGGGEAAVDDQHVAGGKSRDVAGEPAPRAAASRLLDQYFRRDAEPLMQAPDHLDRQAAPPGRFRT
jgi:hypothetical protein